MKKIILFFIFCILVLNDKIYSSSIYRRDFKSDRTEIISESIEYRLGDLKMKIEDSEVTFSENDNNYIFNVEQNFINEDLKKDYTYQYIRPEIALTSFDSINSLTFYGIVENKIYRNGYTSKIDAIVKTGVTNIARYYEYDENLDDKAYTTEDKYCRQTFYLSDCFGYNIVTKKNMDMSMHNLKIDKNFTYSLKESKDDSYKYKYKELSMNVKYKITMDKKDIDNYRYLSTYVPNAFKADYGDIVPSETFNVYNLCTPSIDLKKYVDEHTHDFKIKNIYKDYHELYCKGCNWTKKINHEYTDTYDGIDNNYCICGKHKYVNIHISNNIDDVIYNEKLEVYNDFPTYDMNKLGNHLVKMNIKSKDYNKDTDISGANDGILENDFVDKKNLVLPDKVPNSSTSYYLYYDANKYNIVFDKKNNLNINIDKNMIMNNMIYSVNESKRLSKNKYIVEGYDFIGWCDNENVLYDKNILDKDKVKYLDEEELYNETYENNKTIILYPVYRIIKYTITFKNNINGNVLKNIICDLDSDIEFPKSNEYGLKNSDYGFSGYYINNIKVPNTTQGLIKYIKSDGKGNGSDLEVIAKFYKRSSSDDYSDGPSIDDDDKGGNGDGSNGNDKNNGSNNNKNNNENDNKKDTDDINSDNNINESDTSNNNTNNNQNKNEDEDKNKLDNKDDTKDNDETNKEDSDKEKDDDKKKKGIGDDELDNGGNGGENSDNNTNSLEDGLLDKNKNNNDSIIDKIVSVIKDVFDNIIKGLKDIINNIIKAISKFLDDYNLKELKNLIKSVISSIKDFVSGLISAIKGFINNILNFISPYLNIVINALKNIFGKIWSLLCGLYEKLLDIFGDFNSSVMMIISIFLGGVISIYYLIIFILYIIERKREHMRKNT